jgi:hypothetical protein
MAYGLRYYGEFKDRFNNTVRIEIDKKDYSGAASEMIFAADPGTISYPGTDTDVFKSIFGSELKINLISETDFQYTELSTSDARGFKIRKKIGGVTKWTGWILPDLYSEPYTAAPYTVSISARCGLGELKELDVPEEIQNIYDPNTTSPDTSRSNWVSIFALIYYAISKTETSLPIQENLNIYPSTETSNPQDSPLLQTYINLEWYAEKNLYEAVEDVLRAFLARIYQEDGKWKIRRIIERVYTLREYTVGFGTIYTDPETGLPVAGLRITSFSYTEDQSTTLEIGKPVQRYPIGGGANLDILPAWKGYTVISQRFLRDSIFANHDFTQGDGLEGWTYESDGGTISKVTGGGLRITRKLKVSQKFEVDNGTYTLEGNEYYQRLFLGFKYKLNSELIGDQTVNVIIKIVTSGANIYYLSSEIDEATGYYKWKTSQKEIKFGESTDIAEVSIVSDTIPASGTLEVSIINTCPYAPANEYQPELTSIGYIYPATLLIDQDGGFATEVNNNFTINSNNIYKPDDVEQLVSTLPDINNNQLIYKGGFRTFGEVPVYKWVKANDATELTLLQHNSIDIGRQKNKPQYKLSLPILSEDVNFSSNIVDVQVLPKEYISMKYERNLRSGISKATYVEIGTYSGAPWILEDGTWNDQGIWIDGETWNDEDPIP